MAETFDRAATADDVKHARVALTRVRYETSYLAGPALAHVYGRCLRAKSRGVPQIEGDQIDGHLGWPRGAVSQTTGVSGRRGRKRFSNASIRTAVRR